MPSKKAAAPIDPNFGPSPFTYFANGLLECVCGGTVSVGLNDPENYGQGKTFKDDYVCGQCGETHHVEITASRDFDGEISKLVLARREAEANG